MRRWSWVRRELHSKTVIELEKLLSELRFDLLNLEKKVRRGGRKYGYPFAFTKGALKPGTSIKSLKKRISAVKTVINQKGGRLSNGK